MLLYVNVSRRLTNRDIFVGQFLGFGALIALSLIGFFLGLFIPLPYIGLLGFFPIYLGIKAFFENDDNDAAPGGESDNVSLPFISSGALQVAGISIANGGDNVGVYIPLFASQTRTSLLLMIAIFFLMTMLWLLMSKYLANHKLIAEKLRRYNHIIFPVLLVVLGLYILWECKTYSLFS